MNVPGVTVLGSGIVAFSANGAGSGNGGTIDLTATNFSNINVGGMLPQYSFLARGGSAGSLAGDGGTIKLVTTSTIAVADATLLDASPLGNNGKGANYFFNSTSFGTVSFNGSITADGKGFGDGGTMEVRQSPFTTLILGTSAGITGALLARGGTTGAGGRILVQAGTVVTQGPGAFLNASAFGGNGGKVELIATSLTVNTSGFTLLSADAGSIGKGGSISITAPSSTLTTGIAGGQLFLSARGAFSAGRVTEAQLPYRLRISLSSARPW